MKAPLLALSLLIFLNSWSQQNTLSTGAKILFQNIKCKLTNAEKESIFKQSGFLLSADKKQFIADKDATDFPFDAFVYPDGSE